MTIYISHDNCYTIKRFLKEWAPELRPNIRLIYYADLAFRSTLPRDISLFLDLERLSPALLQLASEAAQVLRQGEVRVLNEPSRVLARYDLLRALHADGVNRFNVYRLDDDRAALSFPVFLRLEKEHQGNLSELLHSAGEVDAAIESATAHGLARDDLLLVEFCDTADAQGMIHKYSAFMVGDQFLPRHLLFSQKWMIKYPDLVDDEKVSEELEYLQQSPHPHESQVRGVFQRAGIEFGRIDYSMLDGKMEVWEINTNPSMVPESAISPSRQKTQEIVRRRLRGAFQTLLENSANLSGTLPFRPSSEVQSRLGIGPGDAMLHPARRALRPFEMQRMRRFVRKKLKF